MPRSGTTLVEQILSTHPAVFGAGELNYLDRIAADLPGRLGTSDGYPECVSRLDAHTVRSIARAHLQRLSEIGCGKGPVPAEITRVTDKMPLNFLHLGLIATLFPRARIVACQREARDVCLSCFFQ